MLEWSAKKNEIRKNISDANISVPDIGRMQ
jgi:hypothetical protein